MTKVTKRLLLEGSNYIAFLMGRDEFYEELLSDSKIHLVDLAEYGQSKKRVFGFPLPGDIVEHYKGDQYCVHSLCINADTGETNVIYHNNVRPEVVYSRSLESWMSESPDGSVRFKLLNP